MGQRNHPLPTLEWKRVELRDGTDLGCYAIRRGLLVIRTITDDEYIRDASKDDATNERIAVWVLSGGDMLRAYPRRQMPEPNGEQKEVAAM